MNWFKSFWKAFTSLLHQPEQLSIEGLSFTPKAQQSLALARIEAQRLNHNFIGTEHLLLALIALGQGIAVNVLTRMGLDLEALRTELEKQAGTGPDQPIGNVPYTPRVKAVLNLAGLEAKALNHTYVGTEHILLGILAEGDGVAGRVLRKLRARGAWQSDRADAFAKPTHASLMLSPARFARNHPRKCLMPSVAP